MRPQQGAKTSSDRPLPPPRNPSQAQAPRPPDQQAQRHPGLYAAGVPGHWASQNRIRPYSVSLASKDARDTSLPNQDQNPSRLVNKYLDSIADHNVRHRPSSKLPFHPNVLSVGGMMNSSTIKVFASLKQVTTLVTYDLMLRRLRLCLLQGRVRSFERYGIHFTVEHRRLDRRAMHCLKTNSRAQRCLGLTRMDVTPRHTDIAR
jgi:hypothetical protein